MCKKSLTCIITANSLHGDRLCELGGLGGEKSGLVRAKRGSVLPLVLIVITLLLVMGLGMLRLGTQARVYAARTSNDIAARGAADAGLTKALWALNQRLGGGLSASPLPGQIEQSLANCYATYSYDMARPGEIPAGPIAASIEEDDPFGVKFPFETRYEIRCTGRSGIAERTVHATVKLQGLFESAVLSQGRISLMPNTLVTGYNSADPTDTDIAVQIGTTSIVAGQIPLSPGTVVEGDVFVGVGGDPATVITIEGSGAITGQKFALTGELQFPVIAPPALPSFGTVIKTVIKGATVTMTPSDSGTYKEIKLGNSEVLEITGGKVVLCLTGNIDLGQSAEIAVRAGSSLVLYAGGNISTGNSAGFVNENSLISTLKIFATRLDTQTLELKAKSDVFGLVYAPNADVQLYPKSKLYGAVVAGNISIKSNGTFYYDEALRNVSSDDEGAHFVVERWWE
jgi:hypothetical protein